MAVWRKSAYLAGLWEDSLNDDLLWSIRARFRTDFDLIRVPGMSTFKKARPWSGTAPAWSWASVDVGNAADLETNYVDEFYGTEMVSLFTNVSPERMNAGFIPAAVDEYGEITHGYLRSVGLVATGKLEKEVEILEVEDSDKDLIIESTVHSIWFSSGVALSIDADYLLDKPGPDQILPGTEVYVFG